MPKAPDLSTIPFPKVKPIRLKGKKMKALRERVFERDGYRCVECGSTFWLELSHNKPRGRGGADTEDNLACRCKICHVRRDHFGCEHHL